VPRHVDWNVLQSAQYIIDLYTTYFGPHANCQSMLLNFDQ